MNHDERQSDRETREHGGRALLRDPEDDNEEQESRNDLEDEGGGEFVIAEIALAKAIGAEAPFRHHEERVACGDDIEDARAGERAKELRHPVLNHFACAHAAGQEGAEGHGGVHMAARDGADAIGHGDDGEAEGEGDAKLADLAAREHGGAAAEENQRRRTDEFRDELLHECPSADWALSTRVG